MNVLITGGQGFLGTILAEKLVQRNSLAANGTMEAIGEIVLLDTAPPPHTLPDKVRVVVGDIRDIPTLVNALSSETTSIFHLASMVSSEAEERWQEAVDTNISGLLSLLRACNDLDLRPRLVFASSVAATRRSNDGHTFQRDPNTTYGTTKAVCELLLNDATRTGVADARIARLPTVIIRPHTPNRAASGFASAIFRELSANRPVRIPVPPEFELLVIGAETAIECLISLHNLGRAHLGAICTVNLPGLTVTVEQMLATLESYLGPSVRDNVRFEINSSIERLLSGWPTQWSGEQATMLGLPQDVSLSRIIQKYLIERGSNSLGQA